MACSGSMTWILDGGIYKIVIKGPPTCSLPCALPHPSVGGGNPTQNCTEKTDAHIQMLIPITYDEGNGDGLVMSTLAVLLPNGPGSDVAFRVESATISQTYNLSVID